MLGMALIGTLPATLINNIPSKLRFVQIKEHTRIWITSSGCQSSTYYRYIDWCYDMLTNLATNKYNTQMVFNKGLTADKEESSSTNLPGGNKS